RVHKQGDGTTWKIRPQLGVCSAKPSTSGPTGARNIKENMDPRYLGNPQRLARSYGLVAVCKHSGKY
ncbi:hypothetical protein RRG08_067242, partial [Elysia crispata]